MISEPGQPGLAAGTGGAPVTYARHPPVRCFEPRVSDAADHPQGDRGEAVDADCVGSRRAQIDDATSHKTRPSGFFRLTPLPALFPLIPPPRTVPSFFDFCGFAGREAGS
jgi:hypothetical protein